MNSQARALSLVALPAAAIAVLAVAPSAGAEPGPRPTETVTVVERAVTDTVVDIGPKGDSLGDTLAFGNPIFSSTNRQRVGHDQGNCVRTAVGRAYECNWTTFVPGGSLTVEGPFYDDLRDSRLAIIGGTGRFDRARGEMTLHTRNTTGTALDFVFHVRS